MGEPIVKWKRNIRGLDILQAIYAFLLALGLREVFVGANSFIQNIFYGSEQVFTLQNIVVALLIINIVLLGLRFFWAPRNLRWVIYCEARKTPALTANLLPHGQVAVHLIIIMLHGALFFFICSEFSFIAFSMSAVSTAKDIPLAGYVVLHCLLLVLNAFWLLGINVAYHSSTTSVGEFWWKNNVIFALLALAPYATLKPCKQDLGSCVSRLWEAGHVTAYASPASPINISNVVLFLKDWIGLGTDGGGNVLMFWVMGVLLLNSVLDLYFTGHNYIRLEEVEWEEVT